MSSATILTGAATALRRPYPMYSTTILTFSAAALRRPYPMSSATILTGAATALRRPYPMSSTTILTFSAAALRRPAPMSTTTILTRSASSSHPRRIPPKPLRCAALRSPLTDVAPYLTPEWAPILKGWLCSAAAVSCLSLTVPRLSRLPCLLSTMSPDNLLREGLIIAALAAARCAASYLQQAFLWEAALRTVYTIRAKVFDRVLHRDMGFFEGKEGVPAGDVAYRITTEAADVADTVYAILNIVVPNTLQLVAMSTQMVAISPTLSLMSALVIPFMSLVIAYLGERLRKISKEANISVARLSAYLNEVLPFMIVVKANNLELNESVRFQRLAHDDMVQRLKKRKMKALIPQIVQVVCIGGALLLSMGSLLLSKNPCDSSKYLSFIMSLALLVDPIQSVGKAYDELKQGEPAVERLFDLTRFTSKVIEKPNAVDLADVTGDIKFGGVTFKYGDNKPPVLDRLDLHIKAGERIALIGPSGGGKTTLTKLLLRLYDPSSGHILVDDRDIQDVTLRSLRDRIVLVSQDIMLFSGTVAENIGYRDLVGTINRERVKYAATVANADEFIRNLPHGYETNIGQRGSLLSGGQRQRLAIARALYHNSSILILDEATSALDSRSELLVRQALERLMANHTVLVIAHRPETVLMADRVLLLDKGKLVEVSKSAFLSQDGSYNSLSSSKIII